jgi:hypothetical protein
MTKEIVVGVLGGLLFAIIVYIGLWGRKNKIHY